MIYDSLYAYSDLNSDIWVLTIGVNGDYYTQTERLHTAQLINEMIRRNPRGTICVLNGLPLPDTTAQERIDRLYSYNQLVADIAAHRRSRGYDVRLVDAFHTLAPDSVFNPDYMVDHLHPNAAGYDLLAREIYRVLTEPQ
jgi:lysophospholipase L1-like esterase